MSARLAPGSSPAVPLHSLRLALGLIAFLPVRAQAQVPPPCPSNQVIANSFGAQVTHMSTGSQDNIVQGGSSAFYNLALGAFSLTGDHGFGQVIAADEYRVQGLPNGTPVTVHARLRVRGNYSGAGLSGTNGSITVTFREGAANSLTLFKSTSGNPGFHGIDSTLVLTVNTVVGGSFVLNYDLRAGGSSQGGSAALAPHNEPWLSFEPLAPGVGVVSCQGFSQAQPTPIAPEVVDASFVDGACTVRWRVDPDARGVPIERRLDGEAWQGRGTASPDDRGLVEWRDADVAQGHSYAWRLNIGGRAQALISLAIPGPGEAELQLVPLQTSTAGVLVSYRTPTDAPARFEVYAVTGRRVETLEIARPGGGPRTQRLLAAGSVAAGAYWVRLTQGPLTRTLRVTRLP